MTITIEKLRAMDGGAALIDAIEAASAERARASALAESKAPPASIAQLRAQFPGADAFCLDCAEKGLSLEAAKAARAEVLARDLADAQKQLAAANEARAKAEAALQSGAAPVPGKPQGPGNAGDSGEAWNEHGTGTAESYAAHVRAALSAGETSLIRAHSIARKADPRGHAAWLQAGGAPKV
jgi:hypothetical protein